MLLQRQLKSDIYNEPYVWNLIGHDGSEMWWPELKEPHCRRGFHTQELTDAALKVGIALLEIDANPYITPIGDTLCKPVFDMESCNLRLIALMDRYHGLLLGDRLNGRGTHMLAWDHLEQLSYDPDGGIQSINELGLSIRSFFIAISMI
jgi:hypothetical protein